MLATNIKIDSNAHCTVGAYSHITDLSKSGITMTARSSVSRQAGAVNKYVTDGTHR